MSSSPTTKKGADGEVVPSADSEQGGMNDSHEAQGHEVEVKEQDRWLPIANVARIMKSALPENAKIAKEAKECMQECVSEFISFITSEASEKCQQEKRKTVNGEDILFAMTSLGFENYSEALKIYLARYRETLLATQKSAATGAGSTGSTGPGGSNSGAVGGPGAAGGAEHEPAGNATSAAAAAAAAAASAAAAGPAAGLPAYGRGAPPPPGAPEHAGDALLTHAGEGFAGYAVHNGNGAGEY
ncbi:hypothetical protein EJ06DRAFT_530506 [Trichodelitschia bisporula]|uniref:Transcription factor CBF/NF-Y/archaeal histone domain-containing protein n=1 Tax=Trichodelitschia bisporula TaxID=703511 RepID=A0A6G1HXJ6_9PEZI|nr:hypothetical protein EJ06DRAFT_530506 [Trichodelitschia bisporula]